MDSEKQWKIRSLTDLEFHAVVDTKTVAIYNTAVFNKLNAAKVEDVFYLVVYKGESPRFSVIFGKDGNRALCPFSAPFGYPEVIRKPAKIKDYYIAYSLIEDFLRKKQITEIKIYMAPEFYDSESISAWMNVLLQNGYRTECCDVNYAFMNIKTLMQNYENRIARNARKNLKRAQKTELEFLKCNKGDAHIVYSIIQQNRIARNHPLHLTEDQVMSTIKVVNHDLFLVRKNGVYVASALIYRIFQDAAQVIYWGDIPEYSHLKPMNFISYEILKYYYDKQFSFIDVGISTNYGVADFGLCDFKESIGCSRTNKYRLYKFLK